VAKKLERRNCKNERGLKSRGIYINDAPGLRHQNVARPSRLRVSAASRPDFYGETLQPRTGTGTVPQLAGEDACATIIPAFLGYNAFLKLDA